MVELGPAHIFLDTTESMIKAAVTLAHCLVGVNLPEISSRNGLSKSYCDYNLALVILVYNCNILVYNSNEEVSQLPSSGKTKLASFKGFRTYVKLHLNSTLANGSINNISIDATN